MSSTSCLGSMRSSTLRRDSKMGELACSSRRRAQPFLLNHCRSENNRACLQGLLYNSNRKEATRSVQTARWARTHSCLRSPNPATTSNVSEPPPSTSRDDPKWMPPLDPDTAPFETEKSHWAQEGVKGPYGIRGKIMLRLPALGSDLKRGNISLTFRFYTASFEKDRPK